jgi:predicted lactoylglutathione lyase
MFQPGEVFGIFGSTKRVNNHYNKTIIRNNIIVCFLGEDTFDNFTKNTKKTKGKSLFTACFGRSFCWK